MKAILYEEYGGPDVLKIREVEKPVPKSGEVLIRVHAVAVNYGDLLARNFRNAPLKEFNMPFLIWVFARLSFGFRYPRVKILGNTFSGKIESVGNSVTQFKAGDAVFGYTGQKMGAYAEYLCMPENDLIAATPSEMTYEEASVVPYGSIMALNLLRKVDIQKGQKVMIIGASGGIGSAAVQLVRHYFGAEVTGVCSKGRAEYVKNLGTDIVLGYENGEFLKTAATYDLIFDILGRSSFSSVKRLLNPEGIYLLASFKTGKLLQMAGTALTGKKKVICTFANPKKDDLVFIKNLIEEGKFKSIIDKSFPLEQTAEAHRYIESGARKGDVVVTTGYL